MKRFKYFCLTLFLIATNSLYGQRFLQEISEIFNQYGKKTTMVVIPSNTFQDLALRDFVTAAWRVSPYEFCTLEEYHKLKESSDLFFLMVVDGKYRSDSEVQIEYLSLSMGGQEIRRANFSSHNMVMLPLQSIDSESTMGIDLLPIYIDVIQDYIYRAQQNAMTAIKKEYVAPEGISELKDKKIYLSLDILNYKTTEALLRDSFRDSDNLHIVKEEQIDQLLKEREPNTVIPIVIEPKDGKVGSYCYKLLIEPSSHKLLYIRRHKVTNRQPVGFTREDVRTLSIPYHF